MSTQKHTSEKFPQHRCQSHQNTAEIYTLRVQENHCANKVQTLPVSKPPASQKVVCSSSEMEWCEN